MKKEKIKKYVDHKLGYGYPIENFGRWYIGPEEGGDKREIPDRIDTWFNIAGSEQSFADLRDFHLDLAVKLRGKSLQDTSRFFTGKKCIQSTWRGIIEIDTSICGIEALTTEQKRTYQVEDLAAPGNPICLLELSPFSSHSLNDKTWQDKESTLEKIHDARVNLLVSNIKKYKPEACIMYSASHWQNWREVIQKCENTEDIRLVNLIDDGQAKYYQGEHTCFVLIHHPAARSMNGTKNILGKRIQEVLNSDNENTNV